MTNIIITFMQIFMGVVLYSLLGVIVAGGYYMLAAFYNRKRALSLSNDNFIIGIICVIWPMFLIVVVLGSFFSKPIEKLGEIICNWFYVEDSKEKENNI